LGSADGREAPRARRGSARPVGAERVAIIL
jgi:hypothetical protein